MPPFKKTALTSNPTRTRHCLCKNRHPLKPLTSVLPHIRNVWTKSKRDNPRSRPSQSDIVRFLLNESTQQGHDRILPPVIEHQLRNTFFADSPSSSLEQELSDAIRRKRKTERASLRTLDRILNRHELRRFIENTTSDEQSDAELRKLQNELGKPFRRLNQSYHSRYELLLLLNGIVSRLERLGGSVISRLFCAGMQYACLCFSAPALDRHLRGFRAAEGEQAQLRFDLSVVLIEALLSNIRIAQFENPDYDLGPMADVVFGSKNENGDSEEDAACLHDILHWNNPEHAEPHSLGFYIFFLAQLDNTGRPLLDSLWHRFIKTITDHPSPESLQSAYACVLALHRPENPKRAAIYLYNLSQSLNNSLPDISQFRDLNSMLAIDELRTVIARCAGKDERKKILESHLGHIEQRLGIQWHPENYTHTSVTDPARIVSKQHPLLTLDCDGNADVDTTGLESQQRLLTEIRTLGSSKTAAELGVIADLLNEHEGTEIPIQIQIQNPGSKDPGNPENPENPGKFEFLWIPHLSPIEFPIPNPQTPDSPENGKVSVSSLLRQDASTPWSPPKLGLLRARPYLNGAPRTTGERTLHLMQLGYLLARPRVFSPPPPPPPPPSSSFSSSNTAGTGTGTETGVGDRETRQWRETGYVVTWDRVNRSFLVVFVGRARGVVGVDIDSDVDVDVDVGVGAGSGNGRAFLSPHPSRLPRGFGLGVVTEIRVGVENTGSETEFARSSLEALRADYSAFGPVGRFWIDVDPTVLGD